MLVIAIEERWHIHCSCNRDSFKSIAIIEV